MQNLMLIGMRKSEFTGSDGQEISGFNYDAMLPNGDLISFWSEVDHEMDVHETQLEYAASMSIDVQLSQKVWEGKRKFREVSEDID